MTAGHEVRRRRLLAVLVGSLLGLTVLGLTSVASGAAQVPGESGPTTSTTTAPPPTTATTLPPTTTTIAETTSTTVEQTTTTARRQTATTQAERIATTTTVAVSTSINVLVPGDGTQGAESTTTTTVQTATKISSQDGHDRLLITLVIVGLLLLAVAVGVLTWRYWAATRPPLAAG